MKKDARPISRQVLSGLKISAVIVALGAGLLYCSSFIPIRIEAFVWHLRHGISVEVGSYRFPAPKEWYVEKSSPDDALLIDLRSGDSIDVREIHRSKRLTLAAWSEWVSHPREDLKVTGRRELRIGNETILCLEEDFDLKKFHVYPISCRSEGALEVSFMPFLTSGNNRKETFYSMLQQTALKR